MSPHPKTVLIVDDNQDIRDLFPIVIRMEGCTVVTADNGVQAIEKSALYSPDLILMDIRMPVMDGYEATRRILSTPQFAHTPVVAVSAHGDGNWEKRAREAGCVEWVRKPLDPSQIHDIIGKYIGSCE